MFSASTWQKAFEVGGPPAVIIFVMGMVAWLLTAKAILPMLQMSRDNTKDQVEIAKHHATSAVALKDAAASVQAASASAQQLLRIAQHMTGTDDDTLNRQNGTGKQS